ncbi:MAG: hypothetical protein OXE50_00440 [Chloroflexi bacterium]|nr:hypothetical protein [Chloroflexota bacterium]
MRRRLLFLFGIILVALTVFVLLNWNDAAAPGGPGLPAPFDDWAALNEPMNAAVYIVPESPAVLSIRAPDGRESEVRNVRFEGVARHPTQEHAARAEFADAADVAQAVSALEEDVWTRESGGTLLFGKPDNAWAERMRAAWAEEARVPWAEYDPAAWRGWLLLPDAPPSTLLGLGFVRNRGELLDGTLSELGVEVGGLGSALRLARMDVASFGLYGEFGDEAPQIDSDVLGGTGAGIIAVAESSYPAFVVRALWGAVVSGAGLDAVTLDGEEAHYRSLEDGWHLMAKRYGRTLYFFVGASRAEVRELVLSVIESQRARRGA